MPAKIIHWVIAICIGALLACYAGLVFLYTWEWFVVPLGVTQITYAHAIGLNIFLSFTRSSPTVFKGLEIDSVAVLRNMLVQPLLILVMCWVIHFFFMG